MPESFRDWRAEFLPVEWRSKLTLDGGLQNSVPTHCGTILDLLLLIPHSRTVFI